MKTTTVILLFLLSFPVFAQDTNEKSPATILKSPYLSSRGRFSRQSELHIEIQNRTDAPIKSVEIQFEIVDRLRRTTRDRLFIKVYDWGLGDRSIKPGKSRTFRVPVEYRLPDGVGDGYGTYWCDSCAVINVVTFKDGSTWERKGWRDEPNPNR